MAIDEVSHLAGEMAFASVVSTEDGDALLIAGKVYRVTGPGGNCADLFSKALRRGGSTDMCAGSMAIGGLAAAGARAHLDDQRLRMAHGIL